ncbi:MAG: bifunctional 3-deoxy-7-phosphoheptulonate synthase/chorismate mutase type II [Bacteroidetes bacterium]|nr:bifunctional 3-deoxy-7-phosphoheptulonate synthase/chorismate mutase type II [Bacteroidota bacterium]
MKRAEIKSLSLEEWNLGFSHPLIIAGPCGVESEDQIHKVAHELKGSKVQLMRGGIWKPRTRPDSFQGIGKDGLRWLKEAGFENNLPVTVEVAHPRHVEEAVATGIDVLWIGARTTVNPFLVQEIADALKGIDIPVMVKNPINPDLELWIGALERLSRAGITKLAAIHRGFSSSEKSRYRNVPQWQIPIELKRRLPAMPLICDPSHISGNRNLISSISQTALDLNYDGLMIEVHTDPDHALSDREQQLTPEAFLRILEELIVRQPLVDDVIFLSLLEELCDRIDKIDEEILVLMAERMRVAREIGQYKKENNMTILQVERWTEILRTRLQSGLTKELSNEFIVRLYELIHQESIEHQTQVMNTTESTDHSQ